MRVVHLGEVLIGLGFLGVSGAVVSTVGDLLWGGRGDFPAFTGLIESIFYFMAVGLLTLGAMLSDRKPVLECDSCGKSWVTS